MNKLFEPLMLKFKMPNWARNPEFCLIDTILEQHPEIIKEMESDVCNGSAKSNFGRGDVPSVEQVVRFAIYKAQKNIDYEEMEYEQDDSKIMEEFVRLEGKIFRQSTLQKYVARISAEKLDWLMVTVNKLMIEAGYEDLDAVTQDSTVTETDIHYPTNNSLIWDCIKESHRLLKKLKDEISAVDYRDYLEGAKKTVYKINNTKCADARTELFRRQLITFTKCINQVSNVVKKKGEYGALTPKSAALMQLLEELLPMMQKVYAQSERHEIKKEKVENKDKIFSIYEPHTDIIVKGRREVKFGHKINMAFGKSNLILGVMIPKGNPSDEKLYQPTMDKVVNDYGVTPRSSVTDGGFASKANMEYAQDKKITNIVFNKIVGSLKNQATSRNMETRLKKWRSAAEAIISNLKRGFDLRRCNWKGWKHYCQKVYWSVIAYNFRVMAAMVIAKIKNKLGGGGAAEAALLIPA